ncbi:hypothetical protein LEP1GSC194_1672 [Leptospira alstonii serovar Sichuan str. 79601]|uniref:Uncharacterized protein n=1 Tax=Leptospira alstonii serovar Sichuan str. 79601 TaxID=1218565 RepID=M6CW44_9LEPT|nr:hypothetical protein LEP1GSC194_1672 [Leptospira alstonii serovar Sichuan str. 79601]
MNMSYSYANGFGVGINIGTPNDMQVGGSVGLNYNAKSGAWGASAGLKVGFGKDAEGNYSNWVDVGYNRNNIGRDNQSSGVSANIRGQYNEKRGLSGSLGLSYDTKAGYGASIGLTSSFGPVSVTPSWSYSEYGGLSSDVQYGFNKNLFNQTNNQNHASANRNLLDDILNGIGGLVGGIGRGAKSAWDGLSGALDSVGNFLSKAYDKIFGSKMYPMMVVGEGIGGEGSSGNGVSHRGGYENINNFEFDEMTYNYEVVDGNGKTVSLEEYRAGLEKKVRDKLTSDPNYKGDVEKDVKRLIQEASQIFMGNIDTEWKGYNDKTGTEKSYILGGINTDSIEIDASGNAHHLTPEESAPQGYAENNLIRRPNNFYFMDAQAVKPGGNGLFPLYQMKFDGTQNQWLGRLVGTVGNQILYPQDGSPVDQVIYPSKPAWAQQGVEGFNYAGNNPWVPMKPPADNRPF